MPKAIQQFNDFLTEFIDNIYTEMHSNTIEYLKNNPNKTDKNKDIIDQIIERYKDSEILKLYSAMMRIQKILNESPAENIPFTEFDIFSKLLEESNLNYKGKLKMFEYFIDKALKGLSKNSITIFIGEDIFEELDTDMDREDFRDFLNHGHSKERSTKKEEEYTEILSEYILEKDHERSTIACSNIKSHFLDKRNSFNETDLKITLMAFEVLNISPRLIAEVNKMLSDEIKERGKEKKSNKPLIVKKEQKRMLSQKEYDQKFRHVQTELYDIQQQRVIKPLVLDEIVELISLLYELNVKENEIIKCIQTINKDGLSAYNNPIIEFNDYYEKMMYCSNQSDIKSSLQNIKDYLQEMFIPTDNDSYLFWKRAIADEIEQVRTILNRDYQYELEKGKEKIKK